MSTVYLVVTEKSYAEGRAIFATLEEAEVYMKEIETKQNLDCFIEAWDLSNATSKVIQN